MTCSRCRHMLLFACSKKYCWRLMKLSMSLCEAEYYVIMTFLNFILSWYLENYWIYVYSYFIQFLIQYFSNNIK